MREKVAASEKMAENAAADVLCVAHGHLLISFAMRWVGMPLTGGPRMLLEAGDVGILRLVAAYLPVGACQNAS